MAENLIKYLLLKQFLGNGEGWAPDGDEPLDNTLLDAAERIQENVEKLMKYLRSLFKDESKIEQAARQAEKLTQVVEEIKEALKLGKDLKKLVRKASNVFSDLSLEVSKLGLRGEKWETVRGFADMIADALRELTAHAYKDIIPTLRAELKRQSEEQQPPHTPRGDNP
jgi:vacuolar-type H+-ATPase subunit I/STV1